jgi:outer membrane factor, OMF family
MLYRVGSWSAIATLMLGHPTLAMAAMAIEANLSSTEPWVPKSEPRIMPATTLAQAPGASLKEFSHEQTLAYAEANNYDLQLAKLQVQQTQAQLDQAKASKLPQVNATAEAFRQENANYSTTPEVRGISSEQFRVQQQTQNNAQEQRQLARQQFQQQLSRLQTQLAQDGVSQQDNVNQQLSELGGRSSNSALLPSRSSVGPLSPFSGFTPSSSGDIDSGVENTLRAAVSVNYTILSSGQRAASIRTAEYQLQLAELDFERQRQQLRQIVANDYYDLQEITALNRVAVGAVANAQKNLNDTIATANAGIRTKFEVLQAQVQLANTQQNLTLAQGLRLSAQRQLAETLNIPVNTNIVASDQAEPNGSWPLSLEESIILALEKRVELPQLLLQRDIAKQRIIIERAALKPQLSSFATVAASGSSVRNATSDGFEGGMDYQVGLRVSVNVFDAGDINARVRDQKKAIETAETQYANQKNQLRFEVEQAFSSLLANRDNIKTARGGVAQATESLALAQLRQQAGLGTSLEVLQAETDLTQAQGDLVSAILDYNRALTALDRATGYSQTLGPPPILELPAGVGPARNTGINQP